MRPILALAVAAAVTAAVPAQAGDIAERVILGFTEDGGRFALEEFGVQDGSGFPYANVIVVDTAKDAWVAGTPVRVRIDEDGAAVAAARAKAAAEAKPALAGIAPRGRTVASNPVTELSADAHKVTFQPRAVLPPIDEPMTLRLEEYPLPAPMEAPTDQPAKGFRLTLETKAGSRVLHADETIPKSRRYPLGYRIADVVTYYPDGGQPVLAVVILTLSYGFEGPDGRHLAVTAALE